MGARCIEQQALAQRLLNQSGRIDRFIEVDGVHKADAADLLDFGNAGKLLAHIFTGFLHMLLKTIGKRVKRCRCSCYRQAAAAKRGAVVARLIRLCDMGRGSAGAHRHSAGNTLRHGHDIGGYSEMLEAKRSTATEDSGLDLVAHHKSTMLLGKIAHRLQEFLRARMHAAFALDALEHDGADIMPLLLEQAGKGLDIIDRRAYETAGQGLERLLLRRLSSSRKRCEGSSMEAAVKDHDGARSAIERLLDFGIVCSCGTGGLFAVAAAAEAGGKVIGIDRFAVGTGIREDLGAIDSRYQKAWGTKIDKFEFITMATQYAGGHIQQDLVKLWCDKSGEAIDWVGDRLAERNIELWHESGDKNDETRYKHFAIGHSPKLPIDPKTGKFKITLAQVVEQYAAKKGARFDYNTKMVKLEKKNGRVTGVIAENADGKYVRYNAAKGVVVATGGYAQNWKMMEALQPWNLRIIGRSGALPGARGDGIRACLWAGAKMDETHSIMMFDRTAIRPDQQPGPDTVKSGDSGFFWIGSQPWLKVNADGRRFMNESGTYENILHADEYQKGHCHYTIFDSNWVKYAEQFKMHGCSRLFPFENGAEPNILWEVFRDRMLPGLIAKGYVQKADTIEELAKKLGLPAAQLKATVARNNELYRKGEDVDYGKEKHRLSAVDKAPFYGAKNTGWMLCTMDGIQINTNMNAIDTEGNPIPGLFVIGNDSGGYFANEYPNLATGMACGRTVTFGRIVGRMLAKA